MMHGFYECVVGFFGVASMKLYLAFGFHHFSFYLVCVLIDKEYLHPSPHHLVASFFIFVLYLSVQSSEKESAVKIEKLPRGIIENDVDNSPAIKRSPGRRVSKSPKRKN